MTLQLVVTVFDNAFGFAEREWIYGPGVEYLVSSAFVPFLATLHADSAVHSYLEQRQRFLDCKGFEQRESNLCGLWLFVAKVKLQKKMLAACHITHQDVSLADVRCKCKKPTSYDFLERHPDHVDSFLLALVVQTHRRRSISLGVFPVPILKEGINLLKGLLNPVKHWRSVFSDHTLTLMPGARLV